MNELPEVLASDAEREGASRRLRDAAAEGRLTLEEFTYGFVNTFSPEDAAAAYETYAVPESGQIFYEAGFANFHLHPPTEVHFKMQARAPLLIVGAEKDNTVPASLARKQFEKYEKHEAYDAQTDYVEFAGRPHFLMIAQGWEEVAEEIDRWVKNALALSAETHSASIKA